MSSVPYIFYNQTANIPLSQLDTNFANVKLSVDYVIQNAQANITSVGTLTALSVSGNVSAASQMTVGGNLTVAGTISASGNTVHGNILTTGLISATGNVTGGNLKTAGSISATGNVVAGNVLTAGAVSATGNMFCNVLTANTLTASTLNSADVSLTGNITVAGNATVNGTTTFINTQNLNITDKNITVANGVSSSALIDGAGIDAGNPTVAYIRYSHANVGWGTANNFNVGGNLTVDGNAFATTPANSTANTQVATTAFVRNIIPTGVITLWYGNIASIPSGWYLCDGGNGTPDLRDRFIVGAGSTYAVAATGGSANAVVVQHNHTATSVVTDPGHSHTLPTQYSGSGGDFPNISGFSGLNVTVANPTGSNTTGITVATTTANAGVSGTNANLPPYYALAYIMKA